MPPPEHSHLHQRAMLWRFSHFDEHSRPVVDTTPEEICVRWDDVITQVRDPNGNEVTSDASVVVLCPVEPGSVMWKGSAEEWYGTGSGGDADVSLGLKEVIRAPETYNIKGRVVFRTASLKTLHGRVPRLG